jgi:RNA polymerase sigma-70 factor (ECF subfamily)
MPDRNDQRFARLIEPHLETLFRAAWRLTRNRADAEDLVQETCVRAFQRLDTLTDDGGVKSWLLRVMHNLFVDGARRARIAPFIRDDGQEGSAAGQSICPSPTPEESLERSQRIHQLDQAWGLLEPSHRAVLGLRAEGYSNTEIAAITGISADAVGMRLQRARRNLTQALQQDCAANHPIRLEAVK